MAKKLTTQEVPAPATLEQALEVIAQQAETITALNGHITKLEAKAASGNTKPTIELDGKEYTINSGARIEGKVYTAAELAENADAASSLLAIEGQQVLTLTEGGE